MRTVVVKWLAMGVVAGCGAPASTFVDVQALPSVHRPVWLETVVDDLDAVEGCVAARRQEAFAVYVYREMQLETGVTTVGRDGAVVHCTWDATEGEVVAQRPLGMGGAELSRQPLVSVGESQPTVPAESHLEPLQLGSRTVAWVFWMPE